jgi:hypothetical protein
MPPGLAEAEKQESRSMAGLIETANVVARVFRDCPDHKLWIVGLLQYEATSSG